MENLDKLVNELRKLPTETQWLEFKHNNYTPDMIGKDISALANSASLYEKSCAYMLWGIDDETHEIVGTDYDLQTLKKGNQELENWLRSLLSKNADFEFHTVQMAEEKRVGVYPHSKIIQQKGICFEEYISFVKNYRYDCKLTFMQENGKVIEIFYVPARNDKIEIAIPDYCIYNVSGNNIDGFIVTIWRKDDDEK